MVKKVAARSKAGAKKRTPSTVREKKLLKDLEVRSANVKGGARKRSY